MDPEFVNDQDKKRAEEDEARKAWRKKKEMEIKHFQDS